MDAAGDPNRSLFAEAGLVRIWRTEIDPDRSRDGEFAQTRSVPMFRRRAAFLAALLCGRGRARLVVTLWRDRSAVDALDASETDRATVSEIEATGFLHDQAVRDQAAPPEPHR